MSERPDETECECFCGSEPCICGDALPRHLLPLRQRFEAVCADLQRTRDALSLSLGDGIAVYDGARQVREERDRLRLEVMRLEAELEARERT